MNLKGKVGLITGASRGIGRCIAIEYAKCGAALALNYSKDEEGIKDTVKYINSIGGYAKAYKADVSEYNQVIEMIDSIVREYGKLDILVNNAGISHVGLFCDMQFEEWNRIIDTNLKGAINTTHCVLKHMLNKKNGSIINISSIWGNNGASCEAVYSASKGGINSFTEAMAKELGPSGIRVNAIAPGVINTEMNKWLSDIEKDSLIEEIPLSRLGDGEEVAKLAAFLASEDSSYITGQVITIDGGMM